MKTTLCLLLELPANHKFWDNEWMFTRDVVLNESRQGNDEASFNEFLATMPRKLRREKIGRAHV